MLEPVTRIQVEKAITWYKANREAIAQRLPLIVPGVTYKTGWPDCMDRQISDYESNKAVPLNLAVTYINSPDRKAREVVRKAIQD